MVEIVHELSEREIVIEELQRLGEITSMYI